MPFSELPKASEANAYKYFNLINSVEAKHFFLSGLSQIRYTRKRSIDHVTRDVYKSLMLPYLKIQETYFMSTSKPPLPNVEGGE